MPDRSVDIYSLRLGGLAHVSGGTFDNYRYLNNKVNSIMGWERDLVHVDRLLDNSVGVVDLIRNNYRLVDTKAFKCKVSMVSAVLDGTGLVSDSDNIYRHYVRNSGRYLSIADTKPDRDIPDWTTLSEDLRAYGLSGNGRLNTLALVFSYGYTLRLCEILDTRVDGEGANHLDLDDGRWIIRDHKMSKKGAVVKDFVIDDDLRVRLSFRCGEEWLVESPAGDKYRGRSVRTLKWGFPNNWDIRASRQTWLVNNSGYTDEEREEWNRILGHSSETVRTYYDNAVVVPKGNSRGQ